MSIENQENQANHKKPPFTDDEFFIASDILGDIKRVKTILDTGIFTFENSQHPLVKSAFIEICILMADLMGKAKKYGTEITFTDDIVIVPGHVENISQLFITMRNLACHLSSAGHLLPDHKSRNLKVGLSIHYGKTKGFTWNFGTNEGGTPESEYTDDTAFYFGMHRLYLRRNIYRALNEATASLIPYLKKVYPSLDYILSMR